MLTKKLRIFTRIYKQFDPSFSLICYYWFIFGLLQISIGLSVFGFVANKYQQRDFLLLLTIHNIWSAIQWAIPKVILNYSRQPTCANKFRIAVFDIKNIIYLFYKTSYLNEEVNRTEPSPSVRLPCLFIVCCVRGQESNLFSSEYFR